MEYGEKTKIFLWTIDEILKKIGNNKPVTVKIQDLESYGTGIIRQSTFTCENYTFHRNTKGNIPHYLLLLQINRFLASAVTKNHFVSRKCHPPVPGAEMI